MRIVERTDDRLVVEDHSWRLAVVLFACALVVAALALRAGGSWLAPALGVILLLWGAWLSNYRARLVLDHSRGQRLLRHELRRLGRTRVREHASADVARVSFSNPPGSRDEDEYLLRLELGDGQSFPLTPGTFGLRDVQPAAEAIRDFVGLESKRTLEEEAGAMAAAGDVIGAVALLRNELGLSLETARERVAALLVDERR